MLPELPSDWWELLSAEYTKPYYSKLIETLEKEYSEHTIFPPVEDLFSAFRFTSVDHLKVVILGQDPYHEKGQAMGLSFSVRPGVKIPPSLQNIYKEISSEYGYTDFAPASGDLRGWAEQGVLLLNTVLTVREGAARSHHGIGWEHFTDACISKIDSLSQPVVFMLWGNDAKSKIPLLRNPSHLILSSAHPSPFSASYGFFGNGHFKKCDAYLSEHGVTPIDWTRTGL